MDGRMKLVFAGSVRDVLAQIRILCLIEGDKPVAQFLAELGAVRTGGVVH